MINELTILNALQDYIVNNLNNYTDDSVDNIDVHNVLLDFPSVDLMTKRSCIFIQPNFASYENLSTNSDDSEFSINLFIICKKDKRDNLLSKVFGYYNALFKMFRTDMTLGGTVDFIDINSFDYYPQVEASAGAAGIEMLISCRYTKDY